MSSFNKLGITIISASDLPYVGDKNSKMEVYAKVLVGNRKMKKTPIDKDGEGNPSWSFSMSFTINESLVKQEGVMVVIKLYRKKQAGSKKDNYIGQVRKSLYELFNEAKKNRSDTCELTLNKGSGKLQFSYRFYDGTGEERPWWKKILMVGVTETFMAGICYFVSF